jgi:hypothetical protein
MTLQGQIKSKTRKGWRGGDHRAIHVFEDGKLGLCAHVFSVQTFKPKPSIKELESDFIKKLGLERFLDRKVDARFDIMGNDGLDEWPICSAYFLNGEFAIGAREYTFGPGYVPTNGKYIVTLGEFKDSVVAYFKTGNQDFEYSDLARIIKESKLPETHKQAVRQLIAN